MSEQIKKLRRRKGLTQGQLGERIGVSQQVITNYERGLREPNLETLSKIAAVLGASFEQIVGAAPVEVEEETSRALQKRFEKVKKLPKDKQKAFIAFVDALTS